MSVGEMAKGQPVSRPAVSQPLRVLESARLVRAVPQGNRRIYSVERDGLEELRRYLEGFWSDVLSAYGAEYETAGPRNRRLRGPGPPLTPLS